jgi:hypothetical protein
MSDLFEAPAPVIAVRFKWSDATYDYFCDFPVSVGDKVVVDTKRGEAVVEVFEIKSESDRATKHAKRLAEKGE